MSERPVPTVTLVALTHDLVRKRSIVSLVWTHDPEKNLALPVPFGYTLDAVRGEAERALRALSAEMAGIAIAA